MYGAPQQTPPPYGAPPGYPPPVPVYGYGPGAPYSAYGVQQPARMKRQVAGLSVAVVALLVTAAALALLDTFAMAWRITLIKQLQDDPLSVAQSTVDASDNLVRVASILLVVATIATAVLFICWFWAARNNAEAYNPNRGTMGVGWSVGGWFIPLAALVIPCVVARDIYRGTMAGRPGKTQGGGAITGWWWGVWVASWVLLTVANDAAGKPDQSLGADEYLRQLRDAAGTYVVAFPLLVAAAVLAIAYVRTITATQKARNAEGQAPAGPMMGAHGFGMPMQYPYPYPYPGAPVPPPIYPPYGQPGIPAQYGQPIPGGIVARAAAMATPGHPPVPQYTPVTAPAPAAAPVPVQDVVPVQEVVPVQDMVPTPTIVDHAPEMATRALPAQDAVPPAAGEDTVAEPAASADKPGEANLVADAEPAASADKPGETNSASDAEPAASADKPGETNSASDAEPAASAAKPGETNSASDAEPATAAETPVAAAEPDHLVPPS